MNPFGPYLPLYGPGAHPKRPWWRKWGDNFSARVDEQRWSRIWDDRWHLFEDDLANIDNTHPVEVPLILPGQVWVWPMGAWIVENGCSVNIPPGGSAQVLSVLHGRPVFVLIRADVVPNPPALVCGPIGPPPDAVLVAGPTPWGRDVPWAPAGWRP